MRKGVEGEARGVETEIDSDAVFEEIVAKNIETKIQAAEETGGQFWSHLKQEFEPRLKRVLSPDEESVQAYSDTEVDRVTGGDEQRIGSWLALNAADIKKTRLLAKLKDGELPSDQLRLLLKDHSLFGEQDVRGGNVSVRMHNIDRISIPATEKLLDMLGVHMDQDAIERGDAEYDALWENVKEPGGKVVWGKYRKRKHVQTTQEENRFKGLQPGNIQNMKWQTDSRLYKTSVPGFLLEVGAWDSSGSKTRTISGHYVLPERFKQMKEQQEK